MASGDGNLQEPEYWNNPDGVKIATYKWIPQNEIKFLVYSVLGYADYAHAYPKLVQGYTDAGGAVFTHEHIYHG